MSKNLDQIFTANPITSNASTDLMYFMQSPYSSGTDAGMTYANFAAQFGAPYTPAALTESNDTNVTLTLGGTPATALLHAVSITAGWTGTLAPIRGGLGINTVPTNGQVPIGNGTTYTAAALTQGTGITITNGAGSITIAATGAVPLSFAADSGTATPSANSITITGGGIGLTTTGSGSTIGLTGTLNVANGGTGDASFTAYSVICGGTTSTGALQSVASVGTAGQVLTSNGAAALPTWQNAGLATVDQTTGSVTMAVNTQYITDNGASLVTYTLPTTCALGSVFYIVGKSSGGWKVAQNSGQQINLGSSPTTLGATGFIASTNQYDGLEIVCITADTTFACRGVQGAITVN